jgi:quercetin dioxygenase-like cupin family protein
MTRSTGNHLFCHGPDLIGSVLGLEANFPRVPRLGSRPARCSADKSSRAAVQRVTSWADAVRLIRVYGGRGAYTAAVPQLGKAGHGSGWGGDGQSRFKGAVRLAAYGRINGREFCEFDLHLDEGALVAAPHLHPGQQERFEVKSGSIRLRSEGQEELLSAGDGRTIEPGVVHAWGNAASGDTRHRAAHAGAAQRSVLCLLLQGG